MKIQIIAIAGMDQDRVIGFQNKLPWHLPEDMKHFSQLTKGHSVLMGRKTFESLPAKFKPLPGRKNIVISRTISGIPEMPEVLFYKTLAEFFTSLKNGELQLPSEKLWVIGGEQIYRATMHLWHEVELTLVQGEHEGDAYFPEFEDKFEVEHREDYPGYSFLRYTRK